MGYQPLPEHITYLGPNHARPKKSRLQQHLEETAQLKDEPLIWQDYNDYPAPLVPSVDKALISHEVAPIRLGEAFKHVMDARQLWKTVDVTILYFFWGAIAGVLIGFLWIVR